MEAYLNKYHGVRDYMKSVVEKARQDGYVSTLYGRRRALPELKSSNFNMRQFGERVALNMPIQGTAADIIKMAMVSIHRRLKEEHLQAQMIMQVHDELNFNVPEDEVERVREIVVGEMQHVVHLSIPLIADCGVGKNWLEAH
jgi:DNA polymerase-1